MTATTRWLHYFRSNQAEPSEIPWAEARPPASGLARVLIPSLQQFQLGENAAGLHFLQLAQRHARAAGDPDFPEAIALFIAEEQRHSQMLARYLHQVGAPLLRQHWVHTVFRRLRHVMGLECKVSVLVTAEVMAIPYYSAVARAAQCPALAAICRRILREEVAHLSFQGNTLRSLAARRPLWLSRPVHLLQRLLLVSTFLVTWFEHRSVFRAAGYRFQKVWRSAAAAFRLVHRFG
jgi:hypothetical protein